MFHGTVDVGLHDKPAKRPLASRDEFALSHRNGDGANHIDKQLAHGTD
jgi:hypothetical protein